MSLVSCLVNNGGIIIISDFAITTDEDVDAIHIPAINRPYHDRDFEGRRKPYSFAIKTIIVKERLCVGFVGNVHDIKQLRAYILDYFLYREITMDTIESMIREGDITSNYPDAAAVICFAQAQTTDQAAFTRVLRIGDWHVTHGKSLQALISGGTGQENWDKQLSEHLAYHPITSKSKTIEILGYSLLTCMYFINDQLVSPDTLYEGWGGGFDIVYFEDGCFKRLNDICYIVWRIDIQEHEGSQFVPLSVIRYVYHDSQLYIHHYNGEYNVYLITELGALPHEADENAVRIQYECSLIVSCVHVMKGEQKITTLFSENGEPNGPPLLYVDQTETGHLSFAFSVKFQDALRDLVDQVT